MVTRRKKPSSLYPQVDAAWDAHQADPQNAVLESRLYETLLKMAIAEAGRRFGRADEDAAGVALVRLTEALKSNAYAKIEGAKFSTWAQRVVNNAVMDEFRTELARRKAERELDNNKLHSMQADPGLKVERQERLVALEAVKASLPSRQRQVVEGLLAGKSGEEIGAELGMSRQAVNKLWKRALKSVQDGR